MGNEWCTARGFEIYTTKGQTRSDLFATVIFEQLQEDFPTADGYKHRTDSSDGDPDKEANFTVLMGNNYWGVLSSGYSRIIPMTWLYSKMTQ